MGGLLLRVPMWARVPVRYFARAAETSARTWRSAFGTRCAVADFTVESLDGFASYSSYEAPNRRRECWPTSHH